MSDEIKRKINQIAEEKYIQAGVIPMTVGQNVIPLTVGQADRSVTTNCNYGDLLQAELRAKKDEQEKHYKAAQQAAKQAERRELFKSVSIMLYRQWLKSTSGVNYKQYIEAQGATITEIILSAADEFSTRTEVRSSLGESKKDSHE